MFQLSIFIKFEVSRNLPIYIPNQSLPVSTNMQSLKKIDEKLLKLESGNEKKKNAFLTSIKGHNSKVI